MKGFAFVLLCALVAVQARHTGVQKSTRAVAALGENPWVVHLRIAVATSGLLNSCAGSIIDSRWVLTAASCLTDVRFIWVRYGVVNVLNPSLVTENSLVRINPKYDPETGANNIALININRNVASTNYISPAALANPTTETPEAANLCVFGEDESGNPGEELNCYEVAVAEEDGSLTVASDEVAATSYDIGAPLVSNGVQVGILTGAADEDSIGKFIATAEYLEWIEEETGVVFNPEADPEVAPEVVRFVN